MRAPTSLADRIVESVCDLVACATGEPVATPETHTYWTWAGEGGTVPRGTVSLHRAPFHPNPGERLIRAEVTFHEVDQ